MNLQDFVAKVQQAKLGQSALLLAFAGAEAFTLSDGTETVILSVDDLREKWGESIWKTFESNFVVPKTDKQPAVELTQLPDAVAAMLAEEFNPAPNVLSAINRLSYTLVRVAQEHFGVAAAPKWDTAVNNLKTALEAALAAPTAEENTSVPEVPVVEESTDLAQSAAPVEQPLPPAVSPETSVVEVINTNPTITESNLPAVLKKLMAINANVVASQAKIGQAISVLVEALQTSGQTLESINAVYTNFQQEVTPALTEKND